MTSSSVFYESDSSRPGSANSSRPTSACSSRPSSVCGSHTLTAPVVSDMGPPSSCFHSHSLVAPSPQEEVTSEVSQNPSVLVCPPISVIQDGLEKLRTLLPAPWFPIADQTGFHLLLPSLQKPIAVQREVFISFNGSVMVYCHCVPVPSFPKLFKLDKNTIPQFNASNLNDYCAKSVLLVKLFLQYDVCVGANHMETRNVWYMIGNSYVDTNPYKEVKYVETCRSVSCLRIIELGHGKRCKECSAVMNNIIERKDFLLSATAKKTVGNQHLTREQAIQKAEQAQAEIRKKDKQIAYLKTRMQDILEAEGVNLEDDLSENFTAILMASPKLTEVQKWFLQEQWNQAHHSDSRVHRWHPAMIRLALHLQWTSDAAYEDWRDLGIIKLPCKRTLFDYSHAIQAKDGINEGILKLVFKRVENFLEYQKFHNVLCDGMHVSQNLVYRKSDGVLVGYSTLDDVDKELQKFDNYVTGKEPVVNERQLATEVVAYMLKGVASDVKCVVASYPCKVWTKSMMYARSWDVIRILEKNGLKVLSFICDGHPVNRAFFKMHTPITKKTHFGVVFDTLNFCAPIERPIFFISDLCHVLKTMRNGFYNSGEGSKKPRWLIKNGEHIEWKTIVRLYLMYKNCNFRKSYKLNAKNVFPNSYSKMRVRDAAQVLSDTIALDIEQQKWPHTSETVKFIRYCNKFFDCLNGAHSSQAGRHRKPDLAAYTSLDDERFTWLNDVFLMYLVEWREEVEAMPWTPRVKERSLLPRTTYEGIELAIKGIEGATKYFLDPEKGGGKFVMARVFSQDPLEQHFSGQRARGGGNRNPNVSAFQHQQVRSALQRDLGVGKKRGNVTNEGEGGMKISAEPLQKRKRTVKE